MAWPIVMVLFVATQGSAVAEKQPAGVAAPAAKAANGAPAPAGEKGAQPAAAKNATPAPAADGGGGGSGGMGTIVMFGGMFFLLYMFMIRPQQQQQNKQKQMLSALKKNDRVQTSSGIFGTVVSADTTSDKVVIRVDDDKGVKVTFSKASIVRVIDPQSEKAAESSSS